MAKNEVSVLIKAKDLASKVVKGFENNLRAVGRTIKSVAIGLTSAAAAGAAMVAGLGRLATRGRDVTSVQNAFNRVAGGEGTAALRQLRDQTQGLITDYELMARANQAITLGAVKNTEEFGVLAEAAIALGRAQGVDALQGLDSMVTGLGRLSNRRLDNLGIIVSQQEANRRYAAEIGKSVSALTEAERAEAFRAEGMRQAQIKMQELGGITRETGDLVGSLTNRIKNMVDQTAVWVNESDGVRDFFLAMETGLDMLEQKLPGILRNLSSFATTILDMTGLSDPYMRAIQQVARSGDRQQIETRLGVERSMLEGDRETLLDQRAMLMAQGLVDEFGQVYEPRNFTTPEQEALIEQYERLRADVESTVAVIDILEEALQNLASTSSAAAEEIATADPFAAVAKGTPRFSGRPLFPTDPSGRPEGRVSALLSMAGPGPGTPQGQIAARGAESMAGFLQDRARQPGGLSDFHVDAARDQMAALGFSQDEIDKWVESVVAGTEQVSEAGGVAIASFAGMAQAAISGSQQMEQVVISTFTNILQSLAQKDGPLGGIFGGLGVPVIGAIGGIVGAIVGRATRSDPQPVKVEDYSSRAEQKMKAANKGPETVQVVLVNPEGQEISRVTQRLRRFEAVDGVSRIPRGTD